MERRRHRRFDLKQLVELSFGRERFVHAEGIDISRSGVRCQTNEELDVSSTVSIYFTLDEDQEHAETLTAEAVVKRCDFLGDESYDVGMEFSNLTPKAEKVLDETLSDEDH